MLHLGCLISIWNRDSNHVLSGYRWRLRKNEPDREKQARWRLKKANWTEREASRGTACGWMSRTAEKRAMQGETSRTEEKVSRHRGWASRAPRSAPCARNLYAQTVRSHTVCTIRIQR
ncbi:hypothetical protein BS78_05G183600 [Paspalum vaginatum]|nr:hypothetical protein BS78_05G183600 [Paspalum vaginatum]